MNTLISKFEKIFVNGEVVYSQDSEKPYQATLKTTTCSNNDNDSNCNWAIKEKNHRYQITCFPGDWGVSIGYWCCNKLNKEHLHE